MTHAPTLLIVEDDETLSRMLARLLADVAAVARASDGQDALDWLATHPTPTAIVTDRSMPRLDGLALVRALKHDPRLKSVPVLMLTATGGARGTVEAINAGVRHYVAKPFKTAELVGKVKKMLAEAHGAIRPSLQPTVVPPARTGLSLDCDLSSLVAALGSADEHEEIITLDSADVVDVGPA